MSISVVGSINMDLVVSASRLPSKGETVLGDNLSYHPGGKGANQACAIGRLGGQVKMFGCVGKDIFGSQMADNLTKAGVDTSYLRQTDHSQSGTALISVAEQDNTIIVIPGANNLVDVDYIKQIKQYLISSDLVLIQLEIPIATVDYVCHLCYEHSVPVLLNPAPAKNLSKHILQNATYITPNENEANIMYPNFDSLENLVKQYPERLIITLGDQGVIAANKNQEPIYTPALKVNAIDTTGAGDTFNGAFGYAISQQMPLEKALIFANTAAAISTQKLGAQTGMPSLDEVNDLLRNSKNYQKC